MSPSLPNLHQTSLQACRALKRATRLVPDWLLLTAALLVGAGAATGVVLSQELQGRISVSVSQALLLGQPQITGLQPGQQTFVSVSDDGTQFSAAVQAFTGDTFSVKLPISNESNGDIVAELILIAPVTGGTTTSDTITVGANGFGVINDVVQIAPGMWKFTVDANANGGASDGITLAIVVGNSVPPGFYTFTGTIKAVPF